ncbi:tol-pal system protein YbgF [Catenovulum adriaticum]|uniref:Cell division coordinator CpoB n=1 Tax=Catenovulum adriaticum TaxID=2984846 RepID=A0ABY7AS74_9ALTE|nr:tol-pal system protein YbgF [Catenovulum sp. TS8]WAJ71209.1 tol-pal system protein YbgF [Catenovulum sp. TS8]
MNKLFTVMALSMGVASVTCTPAVYAERNMSLGERIEQLERSVDARSRSQAQMSQQVDSLQGEIAQLRGISEEYNYKLSQILERQRELYQEFDKLSQLTQQMGQLNQNQSNGSDQGFGLSNNQGSSGTGNDNSSYSSNMSENQAYDKAVNLVLKDKRYEQAIPEFQTFIQQYPNSIYQPNAHYWLGQLLFTKGQYDEAASSFNTVVERYTDSNKRPDALFKLGMVAQKLNKPSLAKQKYQQAISEYPDSTAAKLARTRLSGL